MKTKEQTRTNNCTICNSAIAQLRTRYDYTTLQTLIATAGDERNKRWHTDIYICRHCFKDRYKSEINNTVTWCLERLFDGTKNVNMTTVYETLLKVGFSNSEIKEAEQDILLYFKRV